MVKQMAWADFVLLASIVNLAFCEEILSRQEILNKLLNSSVYDPRISPHYEKDSPTSITIQMYITSIDSLSEASMDFSISIFLRQIWVDERLNFTNISNIPQLELDQKLIDRVWVPDTYFANEKHATFHYVTVPNKLLHLYRNGTVFFSVRISMTISCYMMLQTYPMDSQRCPIYIESYGYTVENLVFKWKKERPIEIPDVGLPQFYLPRTPTAEDCNKSYGITGEFTCIKAEIHLNRNFGYYIVQIFVPGSLIVVLSWVSFWIDVDAVPARISLGILTVLTMTTQTSGIHASLPRVSYIKAIDLWMAVCMVFVFGALLEFAYVNVLSRRYRLYLHGKLNTNGSLPSTVSCSYVGNSKIIQRARLADKVSRVVFPLSFFIFNLVFWVYFLHWKDIISNE